jgi:hypothetical protein
MNISSCQASGWPDVSECPVSVEAQVTAPIAYAGYRVK